MANLTQANATRRDKALDARANYAAYGIINLREFLTLSFQDGCTVEVAEVPDTAALDRARREYERLSSIPFGQNPVPIGNDRHPRTIHYNGLKQKLAEGITKKEYRLHRVDKEYFSVINKTAYDYFMSLKDEALKAA